MPSILLFKAYGDITSYSKSDKLNTTYTSNLLYLTKDNTKITTSFKKSKSNLFSEGATLKNTKKSNFVRVLSKSKSLLVKFAENKKIFREEQFFKESFLTENPLIFKHCDFFLNRQKSSSTNKLNKKNSFATNFNLLENKFSIKFLKGFMAEMGNKREASEDYNFLLSLIEDFNETHRKLFFEFEEFQNVFFKDFDNIINKTSQKKIEELTDFKPFLTNLKKSITIINLKIIEEQDENLIFLAQRMKINFNNLIKKLWKLITQFEDSLFKKNFAATYF